MTTPPEVERIKKAYQKYKDDGIAERLWSSSNPGNRAISNERWHRLERILGQFGYLPLTNTQILDIGCGHGDLLARLESLHASSPSLFGMDLLEERVSAARQHYPQLQIQQGNAAFLHYASNSFDLVLFFTVFSSVLDAALRRQMADEAIRVLKPGGAVIWYDFRYPSPRNPNTTPMTSGRIRSLFPDFNIHLEPVTLLPPLARRLGPLTNRLYGVLSSAPILCSHYLGLFIKPISTQ